MERNGYSHNPEQTHAHQEMHEKKNGSAEITTVQFNEWEVKVCNKEHVMPERAVEQGRELIESWVDKFPQEETWVRRTQGVPSLIVRLDTSIENDDLKPYEIEERPSGIGISTVINPTFKNNLERMKANWPNFEVVTSSDPRRRWSDDPLWLPVGDKDRSRGLVLVRAEPEETDFHHLERQSISSVKAKGDKTYGEKLGLWKPISNPDDLPWDETFALKPKKGSKTRDLYIWMSPDASRVFSGDGSRRIQGSHTRSKINEALLQNGSMYLQPFHAPMESNIGNDQYKWMIYRVYYGYDILNQQWAYLGGAWNARSNLKIHGATDTVFGPVT